ncbi:hypothetical protein NME41_07075 [Streptococcus agalactiae]|nr:hypothetical protein [Streptococcus agalactiae]
MKEFGEAFKVIRKSKGIKIIDISDEQISNLKSPDLREESQQLLFLN